MAGEKAKYTTQNAYGKEQSYEEKLVSTEDAGSEWFWELKEEEFFGAQNDPTENGKTASEFKKLWNSDKKTEYKNKPISKLIKGLCQKAYNTAKKDTDDAQTQYPKGDVGKFCTLEGVALT